MRAHARVSRHVLARHVEGASHMAEGYTRARAGNIGVCIGTSGPAGTDMITGLYSASADSIPILCITGQAPVARLHKEDFQAVDITAIAKPVTKMAMTVLEPAQVPGAFQQAFHLMRSGRPGPVLIDLPFDVQLAEIDFDPETYAPLPVYKPAATRAQAEKAMDLLVSARRPVIVAGGGIINADAAAQLVEFAELAGVPVIPTLMGWGAIPDDHPLMAGMAGLQTAHRYGNATLLESDLVLGIGNRWANRHTGGLDTYRRGRRFIHIDIEPTQIGRVFAPDYGIVSDAGAALELLVDVAHARKGNGTLPDWSSWVQSCQERKRTLRSGAPTSTTPGQAAAGLRGDEPRVRPGDPVREHDRPLADRRRPVPARLPAAALDQLRAGRPARLDGASRPRRGRRRPADPGRGAVRRLRLPVHDRGAGGRRAVPPPVPARAGEQRLPRADPAGAARVRHGLRRELSFDNINAPETGGYGVDHVRVAEGLGCKAIRVTEPGAIAEAFAEAKRLMAEHRVPVVVEIVLERVTNISMGTELDNVVEFEELAVRGEDAPTAIALLD